VGLDQRRGCVVARGVEKQQVRDADQLDQAPDVTGRADDRERAVVASQQRSGAQYQAKAAGIEELQVAEVKNEGPGRFADRGVEDRFQRRDRADVDLTSHGNARRSLQPSVDDLKRLDCGQRFFLPVLRRNRSVMVVRGEVFARPRLTNRPVTADRTRVK
jgi:hypothetical protein